MIFLYIAIALVAVFLFLIFPAVRRHPDRKILKGVKFAHRGLHSVYENTPENSIPAFKAAIEKGVGIETDIHITADGKVVVFHDDNLKRMCSLDGAPEDKTLEELKKLKLCNTEFTIPSFEEFLKLVDGKVPLLIELKTKSPKTCAPLCNAANELLKDYEGKYFIQSFYPPALLWYRKNKKEIMRGQLSSGYFKEKGIHMKMLSCLLFNFLARPDFVSYEIKYEKHFCRRLCAFLGAYSFGWTFKSQEEIEENKKKFPTQIFENFIPQ